VSRGPAGALFVAGGSNSLTGSGNFLTLKYSGAGVFRWSPFPASGRLNETLDSDCGPWW
jgi:hypothetical protein